MITDGYKNVTNLRKNNSGLKVLIAIGGWNEGVKKYSDMVSDGAIRKNFVESVIS
jgi:chitinase